MVRRGSMGPLLYSRHPHLVLSRLYSGLVEHGARRKVSVFVCSLRAIEVASEAPADNRILECVVERAKGGRERV